MRQNPRTAYVFKLKMLQGLTYVESLTITVIDVAAESCGIMTYNGKTYTTIKIGDQCWMAENLNDDSHTSGNSYSVAGESCLDATFGLLYDWYAAVDIGNKVPGWHLPTDAEWSILTDRLGSAASSKRVLPAVSMRAWLVAAITIWALMATSGLLRPMVSAMHGTGSSTGRIRVWVATTTVGLISMPYACSRTNPHS